MREYGVYVVTGKREYRGHKPGARFVARIDRYAEARAIYRGDIKLENHMTPALAPGSFEFPDGWLSGQSTPDHQGRREAPHSLRRE